MKKAILYIIVTFLFISCANDDNYIPIENSLDKELKALLIEVSDGKGLSYFVFPDSDSYSKIPQDPKNPITKAKVDLGRLLLHETALGGNPKMNEFKGTYTCASCHNSGAGFGSGLRQGIGECGIGFGSNGNGRLINTEAPIDSVDIQPIRVPTLLNVAYQDVALWNGQLGGTGTNVGTEANWTDIPENFLGFQGIEIQGIVGQNIHRLLVNEGFVDAFGYRTLFDSAFANIPEEDRYSSLNAALALAAYERTILANQAPWQQWLKGDDTAIDDQEKRGAIAFFSKGKCFECHTGPALKDNNFHAFGMGDFDDSQSAIVLDDTSFDAVKKGRGGFTKRSEDNYKFKTPTLYNLADNKFFGHGGTLTSIKEVVQYKIDGISQSTEVTEGNLASQFGTVDLSNQEIEDLVVFLKISLRDPNLARYTPARVNSGFCFPNNDEQSREDLGCN